MKTSYEIPRRTVLRGAAAALSLPLLDIMSPAVGAQADRTHLRLCTLYKGCGVNPSSWDLHGTEKDFELSKLLSPLKENQDDITILSGVDSDHRANGTHVSATLAFMTADVKKSNYRQSQSFDQVIAENDRSGVPVKSLVLRGDPYVDRNDSSENFLSYGADGNPMPVAADPEVVFNSLFRGFNNQKYRQETQSILDEIQESYRAVARRASRNDQQTLEQYLQSVRDVEQQIARFRTNTDEARQQRISQVEEFTAARHMGERIRAMLELIAIAFWTNTTRVATLMMAHTESRGIYDFIGINEEFHYLSHFVRNRKVIPHFDRINQWHTGEFNWFLNRLKSLPDGDRTLFENCIVMYGSGLKHGDYHSVADLPLVLSGGGGGQLKLGRYVRYNHAPNGSLLLKLMQLMGVDRDRFGNSNGPLPGITESGSFLHDVVDDGQWNVQSRKDGVLKVRGRLVVRVTTDDPNLYVMQQSDGSEISIRAKFGNINGNRMDLHVGSVLVLTGEFQEVDGQPVISSVTDYDVEERSKP